MPDEAQPADVPASVPPRVKLPRRSKPGRPLKLTPEIRKGLAEALKLGLDLQTACDICSVGYSTVAAWRAKFQDFDAELRAASAAAVRAMTAKLVSVALNKDDVSALKFWLSRRAKEFQKRDGFEAPEEGGGEAVDRDESFL